MSTCSNCFWITRNCFDIRSTFQRLLFGVLLSEWANQCIVNWFPFQLNRFSSSHSHLTQTTFSKKTWHFWNSCLGASRSKIIYDKCQRAENQLNIKDFNKSFLIATAVSIQTLAFFFSRLFKKGLVIWLVRWFHSNPNTNTEIIFNTNLQMTPKEPWPNTVKSG